MTPVLNRVIVPASDLRGSPKTTRAIIDGEIEGRNSTGDHYPGKLFVMMMNVERAKFGKR